MNNSVPHKRRTRYQGTHPKNFSEKYKELEPDKYGETIEKIIQKGNTPAGMHISICVEEILEILQIQPGQTGLDATFGYGGHTVEMLKRLNANGRLYALDVDPIEIVKTKNRLNKLGYGSEILTVKQMNFANIDRAVTPGSLDFVLADLGVSSMQIDNPERGFTYKREGPLDLRLNPEDGYTAADRLRTISQYELEEILTKNADEPYAREISIAIVSKIKKGLDVTTTTVLREIINETLSFIPAKQRKDAVNKSSQRTFQALRIDINREFDVLSEFLEKLPHVLKTGGRVAILTFHSGEDRLVKKSFKALLNQGIYSDVARNVIRASAAECRENPRARSAKLRWAVKA
ncbi:16S rRNA (cytosine(1402)-N(4))-methyltransferase RsmH [Oscillospiraceae bacterium MB08-C2-2]|nr:16S rRNA (cytosine(1402)-N(4))-methyltransferase RsmH [Oscillospiraceae bacterium MB08-C2-2]